MKGSRGEMQDVELVDVDTDALGPGGAEDGSGAEVERLRRLAARRRMLRRWWPLPAGLIALLLGAQAALGAQERAQVAARQEVEGVLRTVDPALVPTLHLSENLATAVIGGVRFGDLRIGPGNVWQGPRELVAVDATGEQVWTASVEAGGATESPDPSLGLEYPQCLGDAEPVTLVRCLIVDRDGAELVTEEDGDWVPGEPSAARLMTFDPATGDLRDERQVPPNSGWGGGDGLQVLASITGDVLRVTAWDTAADPGGPEHADGPVAWRTDLDLEQVDLTPAALVHPPTVMTMRGHVLVSTSAGSWSLDAGDGQVQAEGQGFVSLTRTGYLTEPSDPTVLLDSTGRTAARLPGTPVSLGVDDASVPGLEIVLEPTDDGLFLTGYDVAAGKSVWSQPRPHWRDSILVLLDGVLYGTDSGAVWAIDAATGHELWHTPTPVLPDGAGLMTDGRNLLLLASTVELTEAGIGVDVPAALADSPALLPSRSLVAFELGTGAVAWATRLPDTVSGVWSQQDDLVAYGETELLLLN